MGATALSAPQPTVPVAFRSLMQAGLVPRTVLILSFSCPTLEMLAPLHVSAQTQLHIMSWSAMTIAWCMPSRGLSGKKHRAYVANHHGPAGVPQRASPHRQQASSL